jgi:hypothetical protein
MIDPIRMAMPFLSASPGLGATIEHYADGRVDPRRLVAERGKQVAPDGREHADDRDREEHPDLHDRRRRTFLGSMLPTTRLT